MDCAESHLVFNTCARSTATVIELELKRMAGLVSERTAAAVCLLMTSPPLSLPCFRPIRGALRRSDHGFCVIWGEREEMINTIAGCCTSTPVLFTHEKLMHHCVVDKDLESTICCCTMFFFLSHKYL